MISPRFEQVLSPCRHSFREEEIRVECVNIVDRPTNVSAGGRMGVKNLSLMVTLSVVKYVQDQRRGERHRSASIRTQPVLCRPTYIPRRVRGTLAP